MKPYHLVLAMAALLIVALTLIAMVWRTEIAPPEAAVYVDAIAQVEGRTAKFLLRQDKPEPCAPLGMAFVRSSDGVTTRLPSIRSVKDTAVIYILQLPASIPDGDATFWAEGDYHCGTYAPARTPHIRFWVGKLEAGK